mmetsp:Transcript_13713/g.23543  ORF Transcript_13713/g.23543 Transcript_13713/m.23543 type:complete len:465 (+) Transcript_13713:144-1538(+)|eukprot:CAMPEP_0196658058 /NCGR_PEP_ID=MMETSP1086-20130531/26981_1 /TAXON_ID=77921 /ORGANISM="Cyanoptyche  gloeocystis , Strain SAG4.97" /LENGTH=464 /DNA_ID=CAMNT_0041991443 /DNA_START=137 /DNA_END=1531 /DNA_ORIENTATION=+
MAFVAQPAAVTPHNGNILSRSVQCSAIPGLKSFPSEAPEHSHTLGSKLFFGDKVFSCGLGPRTFRVSSLEINAEAAAMPQGATLAVPTSEKFTKKATLVLEDGTKVQGYSFGAERSVAGEAVFTTAMVGYPETLTDPSYTGQILVLTYPEIGNYGVPGNEADQYGIPKHFESDKIQVTALVVRNYVDKYSHWEATRSLSQWLKENNVPAIFGVDTRMLTKKLRTAGSMLAKIVFDDEDIPFDDINTRNLVADVSTKKVKTYLPTSPILNKSGKPLRIVAVDCGMKNNMIRIFLKLGCEVTVVPWDFDFNTLDFDGLFISNGPGDPAICTPTIAFLKKAIEGDVPIFGICLGNQLLSLAAGANTYKLKFGNRGINQPCIDVHTGKTYITVQNHGFAVDNDSLPPQWEPYFVNANDGTSEGIRHKTKPIFSVQFHPESAAGPLDATPLFHQFIRIIQGDLSWPPQP